MSSHRHTDDCKEVFALLSQWLDLELPPDACHEIEEHLAGCPPCIEFADSLKKTVALCHEYRDGEVPGPLGDAAKRELLGAYEKMLAARAGRPRQV